jgi:hypothetical protein
MKKKLCVAFHVSFLQGTTPIRTMLAACDTTFQVHRCPDNLATPAGTRSTTTGPMAWCTRQNMTETLPRVIDVAY